MVATPLTRRLSRRPPRGRRPRASAEHADAVDLAAVGDQLGHDPGASSRPASEAPDALLRLDLDAPRAGQLVGAARRHDLALREDDDAVADELDLAQEMRVQEHRDAAPAQLLEQPAHRAAAARVERARRLVEQQQPRAADQRLRDPEPLLHALRHPPRPARPRVGEADELEQLGALGLAAVRAGEPLVEREQLVGSCTSPGSGRARRGTRARRARRRPPARRTTRPSPASGGRGRRRS